MPLVLDINATTRAAEHQVAKLPADKRKHFSGSYTLALLAEPYEALEGQMVESSFSVLKAGLESFACGVRKESGDAGVTTPGFAKLLDCLGEIQEEGKKAGLDKLHHETDLLADLAGVGLYLLNRSLTLLEWHSEDWDKW